MINHYEVKIGRRRYRYKQHLNKILRFMSKHDEVTSKQVSEHLGLSNHYAREMLAYLVYDKKIMKLGYRENHSNVWRIKQ